MTLTWLSPGDPDQRTGGYLWNARIAAALRDEGHEVRVVALAGGWPTPGLTDPRPLDEIPDGGWVVADGLCWPGLAEAGARLAARCRVVVVVHSLLSRETGAAAGLDPWERASWAPCAGRVATSLATASEVPGASVVIPGTDLAPRARGSDGSRVLTVGTLTRRKGHDRLLEALRSVDRPWSLRCAGEPRDPAWAEVLRASSADLPVTWLGELDDAELAAEYDAADLVVQAARYEAFGMAITEAVARGLPVVTCPAGAVAHLPPGAVRVTEPDQLGAAVRALLADPDARREQAEAAWSARSTLPSWALQSQRLLGAFGGREPACYPGRLGGWRV